MWNILEQIRIRILIKLLKLTICGHNTLLTKRVRNLYSIKWKELNCVFP